MKKLLTILLSVLCLFLVVGVNISAEEEPTTIKYPEDDTDSDGVTTATTKIKYEVGDTYTWTISSEIETAVVGKGITVSVTECNLIEGNTLNITVSSTNTWKLKYTDTKQQAYTLTGPVFVEGKDTNKVWANDDIVLSTTLTNAKSVEGVFAWNTTAPSAAGIYEDTLTFTASIVTPE
ncbi:MAG: hypothetical protein KBT35_08435 [Firmicutes bacterium]|nr:hypothetical protein [Candidatus Colivicinus equi]